MLLSECLFILVDVSEWGGALQPSPQYVQTVVMEPEPLENQPGNGGQRMGWELMNVRMGLGLSGSAVKFLV